MIIFFHLPLIKVQIIHECRKGKIPLNSTHPQGKFWFTYFDRPIVMLKLNLESFHFGQIAERNNILKRSIKLIFNHRDNTSNFRTKFDKLNFINIFLKINLQLMSMIQIRYSIAFGILSSDEQGISINTYVKI